MSSSSDSRAKLFRSHPASQLRLCKEGRTDKYSASGKSRRKLVLIVHNGAMAATNDFRDLGIGEIKIYIVVPYALHKFRSLRFTLELCEPGFRADLL